MMRLIPTGAATLLAVLLASAGPVRAADTVNQGAPDLTEVRALIKAKSFAAAREKLMALSETHQHADVYNLLGFSHRKLGAFGPALTYYKKALDFDPNHKGAHEYLGMLYLETKRPADAQKQLSTLEKLCPDGCEERTDLEAALRDAGLLPPAM